MKNIISKRKTILISISIIATICLVALIAFFINIERTKDSSFIDPFFINQINTNNSLGDFAVGYNKAPAMFVTDDVVYIARGRDIIRYDADFKNYSILTTLNAAVGSLHVKDNFIYFTEHRILYRYEIETGLREVLEENVANKVHVGNLIYHLRSHNDGTDLYVFDKETGESRLLVEGDDLITSFYIDPENNRIIFMNRRTFMDDEIFMDYRSIYKTNLEGENRELIHGRNLDFSVFTYDGEIIYWTEFAPGQNRYIYSYNFTTGEKSSFRTIWIQNSIGIIGEYILALCNNFDSPNLYLIDKDGSNIRQIAENVRAFSLTGNSIIYKSRSDNNLYMVDLDGNATRLEYDIDNQAEGSNVAEIDEWFFTNQINSHTEGQFYTSNGLSTFVTSDSVYVYHADNPNSILRFDSHFENPEIVAMNVFANSLYVRGNEIYYIGTGGGGIRRHEMNVFESHHITGAAGKTDNLKVIVDNLIYSRSWASAEDRWGTDLYVFDKETGESRLLVEGDDLITSFYIDPENNRIIFMNRRTFMDDGIFMDYRSIYKTNLEGENRIRIVNEYVQTFIYDGDFIYWLNLYDNLFDFNFSTGEIRLIGNFPNVERINLIGDYIVVIEITSKPEDDLGVPDTNLNLINRDSSGSRILATNIWDFAVAHNHIIYRSADTWRMYVMDLHGNSTVLELESDRWRYFE